MLLLIATLIFKYNTGVYFLIQAGVCISKLLFIHSINMPVLSILCLIGSVVCFTLYLCGRHLKCRNVGQYILAIPGEYPSMTAGKIFKTLYKVE